MVKKTALNILVMLNLFCLVSPAEAKLNRFTGFDAGTMGVTAYVGQPIIARFNYWTGWKTQMNAGLGYDLDNFVTTEANYAIYHYDARDVWKKKKASSVFMFKYGPGAFFSYRLFGSGGGSPIRAGARAFAGVDYVFGNSGWSLSSEIGANLNAIGDSLFGIRAMVGATYYFGGGDGKKPKDQADDLEGDEFMDEEFESEVEPKPEAKVTPKPDPKPKAPPKPAMKPIVRPETKSAAKPIAKPTPKPVKKKSGDEWEGKKWNEKEAVDAKEGEEFF